MNQDEFKRNSDRFCEKIRDISKDIKKEEVYLKKHFVEVFYNLKINKKIETLKKQISQKFEVIRNQLNQKEEELINQLDMKFGECSDFLKEKIEEEVEKLEEKNCQKQKLIDLTLKDLDQNES